MNTRRLLYGILIGASAAGAVTCLAWREIPLALLWIISSVAFLIAWGESTKPHR